MLAERSGDVFATWEWASVWWRHYGVGREQAAIPCTDSDGTIAAILPLCVDRRGPVGVLRWIGFGPGDRLGPICAPEHTHAAAIALRRALTRRPRWQPILLAERLPNELDWGPLGGVELQRESSPVVDAAGLDWDGFLAGRSSNFRSQLGRKERKLLREHDLGYRLCDDPARVRDDMRTMIALHALRWAEEGSSAFSPPADEFHLEFAERALERGWLRLWLAEIDDRAVAAWYGFRYGGCEWFYQSGRDPEWDRLSIGLVLMAHTLREALGDGVDRYHLLRGDEAYKARFATDDPGVRTVALGRGAVGRVLVTAGRAALESAPGLRRIATRGMS